MAALKIVVCVKHTPAATGGVVDPVTGKVKADLPYAVNPWDEYAAEEALRIKEKNAGSTVTVLTLGPARAEEGIRSVLALGCDDGVLVSDPSWPEGDPFATSYLLSLAVKKLAAEKGGVPLVVCGKQSNDNESGQVAQSLAAWLDWPSSAYVRKVQFLDDKAVKLDRAMEDGTDTLELDLPAVFSVIKEINEPRLPSLKGKMASKKAVILKWGQAELQPEAALVDRSKRSKPVKSSAPPARGGGMTVPGKTAQEKATFLVEKLKEMKFI